MFFNSIDFAIFFPIVFVLYWFVTNRSLTLQNALIVVASYVFYGWWDWRFLSLILFSTVVDYCVGRALKNQHNQPRRKLLLLTSIIVNLGLLGFFKYYNFFLDNFITAFSLFGQKIPAHSLNIVLPVGISFYTFQTLSYSIDVYKKKLTPTSDFLAFAAFVSFFPQLVAGPIERAANLLPQFYRKRAFHYHHAVDGLRQILWGFFKKVVIADRAAEIVDQVFAHSAQHSASTLVLAAVLFAVQIYGDFSGYSDIAIGSARLLGFDLMQNFAFPYFSRDIAEFWRRWHISLSTWFRDYLYIPLGGSRCSTPKKIRNILIVFLVSGFWHGANWTFILWGLINALYFLPLMLRRKNRTHLDTVAQSSLFPSPSQALSILTTFALTTFAWIFFRAENISHACQYLAAIASPTLFSLPRPGVGFQSLALTAILLAFFIIIEWLGRREPYALARFAFTWKRPLRHLFYYALIITVLSCSGPDKQFIYFQF